MGQMVSYPQYIRLMRIQKEVINMDKANMQLLYKGGLKKVGLPRLSESYSYSLLTMSASTSLKNSRNLETIFSQPLYRVPLYGSCVLTCESLCR